VPHERDQGSRVLPCDRLARDSIGQPRSFEHSVDIQPLERGSKQANGAQLRSAPADPIEHGEAGLPLLVHGELVQLGARHCDGHGVFRELEAGAFVGSYGELHSVVSFRRAAGLGNHQDQRLVQAAVKLR